MQDAINNESFSLAARVGKVTADELKRAVDKLLAELKGSQQKHRAKTGGLKHGRQTMKSLAKHNAGLSSMELKDPNLRLLNSAMRQNGVDFSLAKDGKGKYTLFFKGRDADALTHAFSQYTQKITEQAAKPSIGETLAAMKAAAKTLAESKDKVKNLNKGAREI
jgi:hypothetical protein